MTPSCWLAGGPAGAGAVRPGRGAGRVMALCGAILGLVSGSLAADAPVPAASEYEVKAVFLLNFVQYVDWPSQAFTSAQSPLVIGILGEDPFGDVLNRTIRGETIKERPVIVKRSRQVDDLKGCHLLFISRSEKGRLARILSRLEGTCVLTVGETDQFVQSGGIINFRLQGSKVRFEINVEAAGHCGLKISSKLLRLATVVVASHGKEGD